MSGSREAGILGKPRGGDFQGAAPLEPSERKESQAERSNGANELERLAHEDALASSDRAAEDTFAYKNMGNGWRSHVARALGEVVATLS